MDYKSVSVLGIFLILTVLKNSEGIQVTPLKVANEGPNSGINLNQDSYQGIGIPPVLLDSEKEASTLNGDGKLLAGSGQFPYQASLRNKQGGHLCSGSVLSRRWILTSADCVHGFHVSDFVIVLGTTNLNSGGTTYLVDRITIHELYETEKAFEYNIAVLQTASEIELGATVQSVTLATEDAGAGLNYYVSSWESDPTGLLQPALRYFEVVTIPASQCQLAFPGNTISAGQICTLGGCRRDSGSPLAANGKQVGIVSRDNSCGLISGLGRPAIYTRVFSHLNWIIEQTEI